MLLSTKILKKQKNIIENDKDKISKNNKFSYGTAKWNCKMQLLNIYIDVRKTLQSCEYH